MALGSHPVASWLVALLSGSALTVIPSVARAACGAPAASETVRAHLTAAEAAYGHDAAAFSLAADAVVADAACLAEPADRALAARIHRAAGMRAYVSRDPQLTVSAFAAARALEPDYRFPESVVPAMNPLQRDYLALDPASGTSVALPLAGEGLWWVDGAAARTRREGRPALVQWLGAEGTVRSAYVTTADLPPDLAPAVPPAPTPPDGALPVATPSETRAQSERGRPGPALAWAAGGCLALAAGGYAVSVATASDFRESSHTDDEYLALANQADGWVLASGGLAALGLGLGIGAVVTLPW